MIEQPIPDEYNSIMIEQPKKHKLHSLLPSRSPPIKLSFKHHKSPSPASANKSPSAASPTINIVIHQVANHSKNKNKMGSACC